MRILVDLQVCQSRSRANARARYSLSLCRALAKHQGSDEVWVLLNNLYPDSVRDIRVALGSFVPADRIVVFTPPLRTAERDSAHVWRKLAAEEMRQSIIHRIRPDIVHVGNLFEGLDDDTVASMTGPESGFVDSVSVYDQIPSSALDPAHKAHSDPAYESRKRKSMKSADVVLTPTAYAKARAVGDLGLDPEVVIDVSFGCDERFSKVAPRANVVSGLRERLGVSDRFILCPVGVMEPEANLVRLIEGFAAIPQTLRERHPLVLAGEISKGTRRRVLSSSRRNRVGRDELLILDEVPDEDLPSLMNLCTLFVFSMESEDLPLPVVEAMACGAPVIAARQTSVSEVIDRDDGLFELEAPGSMARALERGLTDDDFRGALREYGLQRSRDFSWDASAHRVLEALHVQHDRRRERQPGPPRHSSNRERLAFISPLPPEQSGIADYSAEMLPELARHYDIELVTDQPVVADALQSERLPVRSVDWFENNRSRYTRLLYHLGNSEFHAHMLSLLRRHPGVVVLHDFFLGGLMNYLEVTGRIPWMFTDSLLSSHGYVALATLVEEGTEAANMRFPCNLPVLEQATGVIVHSQLSIELAREWYGERVSALFTQVPFMRGVKERVDRDSARRSLGVENGDFIVCSFGHVVETKLHLRLVEAWLSSDQLNTRNCRLVFVGDGHQDPVGGYGHAVARTIEAADATKRIYATGFVTPEEYSTWLAAADVAVQLRTLSRGETSASVFDCLAAGLPLIVNDHGSARELPGSVALRLPDLFSDEELTAAIHRMKDDRALRAELSRAGLEYVRADHNPARVAALYRDAIEHFHQTDHPLEQQQCLLESIIRIETPTTPNAEDVGNVAMGIAADSSPAGLRQMFIDVSAVSRHDLRTGVQRVTRAILREMLLNPPEGFKVEPVYGMQGRFYYARRFTLDFLVDPQGTKLADAPIDAHCGDVFLGLDLVPSMPAECRTELMQLRNRGVQTSWVVYDLLPILIPDCFPDFMLKSYGNWLETVTELGDSLIAISRAVKYELDEWLTTSDMPEAKDMQTSFFHLGADIQESAPTRGLPSDAEELLASWTQCPTFLMVGTIEPRKGHDQVLSAFEHLWHSGLDINLVIVGMEGWIVRPLANRLRKHPEQGKRLHWLESVSDEYLERIYASCVALIAASTGEGFGLPLIEAAQHGLPIIARDIPVFREVVQEQAYYFDTARAGELADAISRWLELYARGAAPSSEEVTWLSWKQSTKELVTAVLGTQPLVAKQP